jgi:hypothetical protein
MSSMSNDETRKRPKTLSRASLYASLESYTQKDPALYMRQQAVSATKQELALVEFFATVSESYNKTLQHKHSKNTACRPLSSREMNDRLKQRALTLVGGGINTTTNVTTKSKMDQDRTLAPTSKRRRETKRILRSEWGGEQVVQQQTFLMNLNRMWNEYIWQLLEHDGRDFAFRFSELSSQVEWVGARVVIEECHQHPTWRGRGGYLIAQTKNTWQVVELKGTTCSGILVIPKLKTCLKVSLPCNDAHEKLSDLCILIQQSNP